MQANPGLYVHLPWCVKKCPYCDFNSHTLGSKAPKDAYVQALLSDLQHQFESFQPPPLGSIFFGGGTPSLFSPAQIGKILDLANRLVGFAADIEITLEANPGTTEHGSFSGYQSAGVNRISLGVQSFNDLHLRALGRIHDAKQAHRAIDAVLASGITRLNLDLMYGLPDQTPEMALDDVDQAIALAPDHISHYNLTIEPNTLFAVHPPHLPDSDACYRMQLGCQQHLTSAGYTQYEVSAFAKAGGASRHNLNYWTFGDYLGIGAGAHGKVSQPDAILRTIKVRHPTQYLTHATSNSSKPVPADEQLFEYMLNGLRLTGPILITDCEQKTQVDTSRLEQKLAMAAERKLMEQTGDGVWQTTPLGWRFLNDLQEIFLP